MNTEFVLMLGFIAIVACGVIVIINGMRHRARVLEMVHRERLAMIERGLTPPPERDPEAFNRGWHLERPNAAAARAQSVGVIVIAFGAGLAILLSLTAGQPGVGLGLGGAIAVIGIAIVINARLSGASSLPPSSTGPQETYASGKRPEPPPPSV